MTRPLPPAPGDVSPHNATNERHFGDIGRRMRLCAEKRELILGGEQ